MGVPGIHPKDTVSVKPGADYEREFIDALFNVNDVIGYRIPHRFSGDIFEMHSDDAERIKKLGIDIEYVNLVDLNSIPAEQRNRIRKESKKKYLSERESAIDKLFHEYGPGKSL